MLEIFLGNERSGDRIVADIGKAGSMLLVVAIRKERRISCRSVSYA